MPLCFCVCLVYVCVCRDGRKETRAETSSRGENKQSKRRNPQKKKKLRLLTFTTATAAMSSDMLFSCSVQCSFLLSFFLYNVNQKVLLCFLLLLFSFIIPTHSLLQRAHHLPLAQRHKHGCLAPLSSSNTSRFSLRHRSLLLVLLTVSREHRH